MIDTHAHLTNERFADGLKEVVDRARAAGVEAIVTLGTNVEDSRAAIRVAERYREVFAAVGVHPHDSGSATAADHAIIRELALLPRVVAIGETGLDYHYDFSPREAQRSSFASHLRFGAELDRPVVVHSREADADLISMIREHGPSVLGVLHSFAGGDELLEEGLSAGWYISFTGMVTFKNFDRADAVRRVPIDRLMIETDSPYLAPVPHRGKCNEPSFVGVIAARLAELRGEDSQELAAACTDNARRFFRLPRNNG